MVRFHLQWHVTAECDQRCKFCYLFDGPTYEQEINNVQNLDGLKKILTDNFEYGVKQRIKFFEEIVNDYRKI